MNKGASCLKIEGTLSGVNCPGGRGVQIPLVLVPNTNTKLACEKTSVNPVSHSGSHQSVGISDHSVSRSESVSQPVDQRASAS